MAGRNDLLRFRVIFWLFLVLSVALGVRLVCLHLDLTQKRHREPRYGFERDVQALRGGIYPAAGIDHPLACSIPVWDYHVDPKAVNLRQHTRKEVAQTVADALNMPFDQVWKAYCNTNSRYVPLCTSIDMEAHARLADSTLVSGLVVTEKHVRRYPQGNLLSPVLGFVSHDPTNSVGAAGLERQYEKFLRGTTGHVKGARDARRKEIYTRRTQDADAQRGCNLFLSVDHNLQHAVERLLVKGMQEHKAQAAWSIVLSVKTGAVLAMASLPDFDPANYNVSTAFDRSNHAIGENYEPGSVMKTITACAVINERLVTPDTMINTAHNDPNYYKLPSDLGHRWEPFMSVRDALVHSSNIVYGKLGVNLGPMKLRGYMAAFGLGAATHVGLPGEERGILPPLKEWDKVKWSRAPIGQGVSVTALQLATAYAAIGNDGELLRPYVVERIVSDAGQIIYQHQKMVVGHPIRPETARTVREMMLGVAKKGGTAKRAAVRGYSVAGKTGTAQMQVRGGRGYSGTDFHASFIGIIPASRPEVVILVTLQRPLFCRSREVAEANNVPIFNHQGGLSAAPIFSQIATVAMRCLEVEPDIPDEIPEDGDEDDL